MQEAGVVLHLARSGRLILKAQGQVKDGSILVDSEGRKSCKVIENIGPVSSPYLSTQPLTDRIERILGQKLFIGDLPQHHKERRFRSNKSGKKRNDQGRRFGQKGRY